MSVDPSQRSVYNSWGGKAGSVRSDRSGGTMSSSSPRSAPRGLVTARPAGGPPSSGSNPPSYQTNPPPGKGPGFPAAPPSYHSYMSAKSGSGGSASQRSGFAPVQPPQGMPQAAGMPHPPPGALSRVDSVSSLSSSYSQHSMMSMPGRPLGSMPPSVAGSTASFRMAMDNSIEYYSDAV